MRSFVVIMTDQQMKRMVGAYGDPTVDTPNLDRLAKRSVRFDRAYTASPVCTPARSAIFTGLHPQVNGALCNNVAPSRAAAMMGEIFSWYGYRAAFIGKWHLDGTDYWGNGLADGGFEDEWWLDGARFAKSLGAERFAAYRAAREPNDLRRAGLTQEQLYGHRVADQAEAFLADTHLDEPFVLVVSFDEPHNPFVAPAEWWERWKHASILPPPNLDASLEEKPRLQEVHRRELPSSYRTGDGERGWPPGWVSRFFACNSWIDRQIGRVLDAADRRADNPVVIYTTDHGEQLGAHGLYGKGPMMYEETTNIPFLIHVPDMPPGVEETTPVSHVDILPTMLELAGIERPEVLNGNSLVPLLHSLESDRRREVLVSFHRFAINQDSMGEFYPIRCLTDGRYKLVINLFDSDELYDLVEDPGETRNRILDHRLADVRDHLHDQMLDELDRIRDPFRTFRWADRSWHSVRSAHYWRGEPGGRPHPGGFPFQTESTGPV